jgi:hypothetical protein
VKPSAAIKNSSHAAANRIHGIVFAYKERYPLRVLGPWPLRGKALPGTAEGEIECKNPSCKQNKKAKQKSETSNRRDRLWHLCCGQPWDSWPPGL